MNQGNNNFDTNIDLVLSMFNQYLYQDCKNNIDDIQYYYMTNPNTMGNNLIDQLLGAINQYPLESIGLPLFQSILSRSGKTQAEMNNIMERLIEYKQYSREQIEPARGFVKDLIASVYVSRAQKLYSKSPAEFINYFKNLNFKTSNVDYLNSKKFGDLDINTMIADESAGGPKSKFDWINQTFLPEASYPKAGLFCVTMPPGCMAGGTEIFLSDGTIITLEELYKRKETDIPIYSWNTDTNKEEKAYAENIQISKYVNSWYRVSISLGELIKTYNVTEDHPFLIKDKGWIRADKLQKGDILVVSNHNENNVKTRCTVLTSEIEYLTEPQPVYDLVNAGKYHNYSVNIDNNLGFFSHNTGKTLFCMQEYLNMALQGKRVHYLCMGDMTELDFIVRCGAQYLGIEFHEAKRNINAVYAELKKAIGDRLDITVVPASAITVDEYIDFMKDKDYDVCFIDYDSQFKSMVGTESMYLVYGDIYAKLSELTVTYKKLVFILAQPMKAAWSLPVIEMDMVNFILAMYKLQ